jgi:hypothetical protein
MADSESADPDIDAFMGLACAAGLLGNLFGLGAAGCMLLRKFYVVAVVGICGMGLFTLMFCPVINLPAAVWALIVLLQPEVKAAFDAPH